MRIKTLLLLMLVALLMTACGGKSKPTATPVPDEPAPVEVESSEADSAEAEEPDEADTEAAEPEEADTEEADTTEADTEAEDAAPEDAVEEEPAAPEATAVPEPTAAPEPVVSGDSAKGEIVYDQLCVACHGPGGIGVEGLGKSMTQSEFVADLSEEELVTFIEVGRDLDDPANSTGVAMPPKGGNPALSDEQILDVIAYMRAIQE